MQRATSLEEVGFRGVSYLLGMGSVKVGYVLLNTYLKQSVFRSVFIIGCRVKLAC